MLGSYLFRYFDRKGYGVWGMGRRRSRNGCIKRVDLTIREDVQDVFAVIKPDVTINCAAIVNLDFCQDNPSMAYAVNTKVADMLSQLAFEGKSHYIQISSDGVFDGMKKFPYNERDLPNPINVYGKTKRAAEIAILNTNNHAIVLRTNIYGHKGEEKSSFSDWLYNSLFRHEPITMFEDFIYSPIYIGNLAQALDEILQGQITGLYHLSGIENCSKFDFGQCFANVFELNAKLILPGSYHGFPFKAPRPGYMALDSSNILRLLKTQILDLRGGLNFYKKEFDSLVQLEAL